MRGFLAYRTPCSENAFDHRNAHLALAQAPDTNLNPVRKPSFTPATPEDAHAFDPSREKAGMPNDDLLSLRPPEKGLCVPDQVQKVRPSVICADVLSASQPGLRTSVTNWPRNSSPTGILVGDPLRDGVMCKRRQILRQRYSNDAVY